MDSNYSTFNSQITNINWFIWPGDIYLTLIDYITNKSELIFSSKKKHIWLTCLIGLYLSNT